MTYRLFLSHSTPTPERDRLHHIADALRHESDGAVSLLYDLDQIRGGDDWRERISYLLHVCQGAAVLLDAAAMRSPWVRAEVTVLSIRAGYDPEFRFVTVAMVDRDELARELSEPGWGPAALRNRQFVADSDPAGLAKAIWAGLSVSGALRGRRSPLERLAGQMAQLMADAVPDDLREIADELDDGIPYVDADESRRGALVIAREVIRKGRMSEARRCLNRLGPDFVSQKGRRLLELLAPVPVDVRAAAFLRRYRTGGGPAPVLMQTRNPVQTVPLHVERAYLAEMAPVVLPLTLRTATANDVRSALRDAARAHLYDDDHLTDDDVDELLGELDGPVFVATTPVDALVLAELSAAYPMVGFVFHHDPTQECDPVESVTRIEPRLSPEDERALFVEHKNAFIGL